MEVLDSHKTSKQINNIEREGNQWRCWTHTKQVNK